MENNCKPRYGEKGFTTEHDWLYVSQHKSGVPTDICRRCPVTRPAKGKLN